MGLEPKGQILKNAVEWLSAERVKNPEANPLLLADKAGARFNLSPKDTDFLYRFVRGEAIEKS